MIQDVKNTADLALVLSMSHDKPAQEAVTAAAEAKVAATEAKAAATETRAAVDDAQEVLDNIPDDYSDLSDAVSNLNGALNSVINDVSQIPLEWESGTITDGIDTPNTKCIRTKGYLCVFDWATLKINKTAADPALYISEYDKDHVFLHRYAYYTAGDFTPQESECKFIRLATYSSTIPAEQHNQYFTAYYDNQYSVSKLYSVISEDKAEQQVINKSVVGVDVKLASAAYEIGANKNNDGNSQYILKNISFPVTNGDILNIKCDDITNATNSTPIVIYQYNSDGANISGVSYSKDSIINGINIIPSIICRKRN